MSKLFVDEMRGNTTNTVFKNTNGTTAMSISSGGIITKPLTPAWFVGKTNTSNAAQDPVVFDDVDVNVGSIYNSTTGKVTIPVAGNYYMFFKILSRAGSVGNGGQAQVRINRQPSGGSNAVIPHSYQYGNTAGGSSEYFSLHTACIATLALNDDITCQTDYQGYTGDGYTAFGGYLIG